MTHSSCFAAAKKRVPDKEQRGPLSKQRNAWLQTALIEAAKLAPRWNPQLAEVYQRELERGHRNRATLQVARKLVAYLMAVDKSGQPFQIRRAPHGRMLSSEEKRNDPASARFPNWLKFVRPAIRRLFLASSATVRGSSPTPDAPVCLFRGQPANPNSIFVDDPKPGLFPPMDVWLRC